MRKYISLFLFLGVFSGSVLAGKCFSHVEGTPRSVEYEQCVTGPNIYFPYYCLGDLKKKPTRKLVKVCCFYGFSNQDIEDSTTLCTLRY